MSRTLWRMKVGVASLGVALAAVAWGADWPTDGGNPQRTNWQRNETILNKENVANLKILWKVKLDNAPRQMHSLLPALVAGQVPTPSGPREILAGGKYGALVPVGDVPALAQAMEAALAGKAPRPSEASWQPYAVDTVVDQYLALLAG